MWFGLGALQSAFVLSTGMRFGWGPQENGWALAAVGVSQAVVQGLLVRPIIRRLGERRARFRRVRMRDAVLCLFRLRAGRLGHLRPPWCCRHSVPSPAPPCEA